MKRILLVILSIMMLTGCESKEKSIFDNYKTVKNNEKIYTESIALTYSEYEAKIQNKDSFVLLMWQTGCGHCETFEPILNEVISKYNLEIYSINLAEVTNEQYSKIKNKTFISGTPTTVVFKDGITQAKKLVGAVKTKDVIDYLVKYNYLEEINE